MAAELNGYKSIVLKTDCYLAIEKQILLNRILNGKYFEEC